MTKPTITMVPTVQVILVRDGKRVAPEIGKGFVFTRAEIDEINASHEGALREPKNEEVVSVEDASENTGDTDTRTPEQKAADADAEKVAQAEAAEAAKTAAAEAKAAAKAKADAKTGDDSGL